jgi:putative transposase
MRDVVVNANFYVLQGGISWRMLPIDFPHWKTLYHYFRQWRITGLWKTIHDRLRALCRKKARRNRQPSVAIIDSQSVKCAEMGGPQRGYDAGKKITGRKRHILVDTLGLMLVVVVHSAATKDWVGAREVFSRIKGRFSRLSKVWADSAYAKDDLPCRVWDMRERVRILLEIVKRSSESEGFSSASEEMDS